MTTVIEGEYEKAQYAERYFKTMAEAIEFTRWITPSALAINPVGFEGEVIYQLVYNWEDSN